MNTLTKYWFLEGFNLFAKIGRRSMMQMCEILEMETVNSGDQISLKHKDQNSIVFLKKGSVKIVNAETKAIKFLVKKGNIFGELGLYDESSFQKEQAFALEESVICYVTAAQMNELMEQHKSLKNGVLKIYGLRIRKLERRLEDLLYKDSATRIKDFVNDYIEEFGEQTTKNKVAKNLLTHQDIASLTNTSRQTVSNTLSQLRKNGHIDYNSKMIKMTN